jgi:hypothetical protein
MMMLGLKSFLLATAVISAPVVAFTAVQLPGGGKTAAEVVALLEQQGYGPFHEISFDDGGWEVEVLKKGKWVELIVDAQSGKILLERPEELQQAAPADAQPLSKLLQDVGKAGYAPIDDASFNRGNWEIDAIRNGNKRELVVNCKTGEVISDRFDD